MQKQLQSKAAVIYPVVMNSLSASAQNLPKPRLLTQLRDCIRTKHYALSTEKVYVHWARTFIRFHGIQHPVEMGAQEVEAFLTYLAVERKVSASTQIRRCRRFCSCTVVCWALICRG